MVNSNLKTAEILGINIDRISMGEAVKRVEQWIEQGGKHYIVTPNLEFILAAQKDTHFKGILNKADLAIPDSSSLGFVYWLSQQSLLRRVLLWPLIFFPFKKQMIHFDSVTGTDLMDNLCKLADKKGFTVGLLGGREGLALKTSDCLKKKYMGLKVVFVSDAGEVDLNGKLDDEGLEIPPIDLLFVAFGHIKQEKWISSNLEKLPIKVAMGVGGAFDYLSGQVPRAPQFIRGLELEWLFRLIRQPWRIKRQLALAKLVWFIVLDR